MEGMTYLAVAYLGMIVGLGIWTYTVFSRSNSLEDRIEALRKSLDKQVSEEKKHLSLKKLFY